MQDRKALQAGTSHFLGQNFSRAQDIKFQDANGQEVYAWTTSWGVSTRLVGALIMTHSDDDGLVLPPRLAPKHVVILPIYRNDEEHSAVIDYCEKLKRQLSAQQYDGREIETFIDNRDMRGGEKNWQHVKRGIPLRVEVGPRDIANDAVFVARRDSQEKQSRPRSEFVAGVGALLEDMQQKLFDRALNLRVENTREITSVNDFREYFTPRDEEKPELHGGFAISHWTEDPETDRLLADLKVTVRCLPLDKNLADGEGKCIFTGKPSTQRVLLAKAY